jgi:hypothetical protein
LNDERKINSSHKWLWYGSAGSYTYIIYVYYFTDAADLSSSDYMKSWIPLDIMLMFFVSIYYFFCKYMQSKIEECEHADEANEIELAINAEPKSPRSPAGNG